MRKLSNLNGFNWDKDEKRLLRIFEEHDDYRADKTVLTGIEINDMHIKLTDASYLTMGCQLMSLVGAFIIRRVEPSLSKIMTYVIVAIIISLIYVTIRHITRNTTFASIKSSILVYVVLSIMQRYARIEFQKDKLDAYENNLNVIAKITYRYRKFLSDESRIGVFTVVEALLTKIKIMRTVNKGVDDSV